MKNLIVLLMLLFLHKLAFGQFDSDLSDKELTDTFTQEEIEEIDSLRSGTVIKRRNADTGLFFDDYNTYQDKNRTSFLFHVNNDITDITGIQSLEFIYGHRFELAWLELFALRTQGRFEEFTDNNSNEGADSTELRESDDSVLAFGGSISYRGSWIQELVDSDLMFTTTSAGLGWYTFNQNLRSKTYSGPGMKADFGLHRRSSRSLHYGLKMSYNLAHVKRAQEFEGETSSQRSQVLSWLSFGFDLSFYF